MAPHGQVARGQDVRGVRIERRASLDGTRQVSRMAGTDGVEAYVGVRPDAGLDAAAQARQVYARFQEVLADLGATRGDVVTEKAFLARIADVESLRPARAAFYGAAAGPATTFLQEPPCRSGLRLELQARVVVGGGAGRVEVVDGDLGAGAGRWVRGTDHDRLFLQNVTGGQPGDGADYAAQTAAMFARAEAVLEAQGLTFRDVVRTWLYLPFMERDYADLNKVRGAFFEAVGVEPPPASTGIQGGVWPADRLGCLDLVAMRHRGPHTIRQMHAPTLNEAWSYGSRFSRGMAVAHADRTVLYVSGTASIDTAGRVYAVGDIAGQVERMLTNVEGLLAGSLATPADVVRATTYLKEPGFLATFEAEWRRRGFPVAAPHTICVADVCRPEWLCETEVVAICAPR